MRLTFLGHSTVRVEIGGRVVLTDPLLTGRVGPLRRIGPCPDRAAYADVDLVLISHLHGDHLHLPSLRLLPSSAPRGGAPRRRGLAAGAGRARGGGAGRRRGARRRRPARVRRARRAQRPPLRPALDGRAAGARDGPPPGGGRPPRLRAQATPTSSTAWPRSGRSTSRCCRCGAGARRSGPATSTPPARPWRSTGCARGSSSRCTGGRSAVAGLTAVPGGPGARMRRLLVHPPRVFAATVAAGGSGTHVAVTEPGAPVRLPVVAR